MESRCAEPGVIVFICHIMEYNGICGRNIYLNKIHQHLKGSLDPQWSDVQRGQRWWTEARIELGLGPKSS